MDIVKKNILSIICGAVALIALVASFWPLGSYTSELEARSREQIQIQQTLQRMLSAHRQWPIVDPENPAQEALDQFPSEAVIAKGRELRNKVQTESQAMMELARKMNEHKPLVPESLPKPDDRAAFSFRDYYRKMLVAAEPGAIAGSLALNVLKGGVPPTSEEINREADARKKDAEKRILTIAGQKDPVSEQRVNTALRTELLGLPAKMRRQAAEKIMVYVNPDAMYLSTFISGPSAPNATQIWQAQIGLWIQQDVADAIATMNKNSAAKNVMESPIKHLIKIEVTDQMPQLRAGEMPVVDPNSSSQRNTAQFPTGRVSNPLYDVTRFRLIVNVEAEKIPAFIQELEKGRFITVYQAEVEKVDSPLAAIRDGYMYGPAPVAQLTLQCEALFLRNWTVPLMPPAIQQALGLAPAPGTNPG